jgi:hypothetical protein
VEVGKCYLDEPRDKSRVSLVCFTLIICVHKNSRFKLLSSSNLHNKVLWLLVLNFTGSPIHPPLGALNSYGPNPRVMKAGEHREDKEGECFVRFGHGDGLTPSGITVKVRTCEERKRFGFGSH